MKQFNKNILWNSVGNTVYNGLQWLITVIVARRDGLGAEGILSAAMSISLAFRAIAYFGIRDFQVSDRENKYSQGNYMSLRIITCAVSLASCVIFSLISGFEKNQTEAIIWYMLFRVSEGFSDLFQGIMQKSGRLDKAGIALTVKAVITTVSFAAGAFIFNSLNTGLFFMAVSALAETFIFELRTAVKFADGFKINFNSCGKLASETLPMFIYLLEASVIFNSPKYFISVLCDEFLLGAYSAFFSIALIAQAVFQYAYTPFITEFSKMNALKKSVEFSRLKNKIVIIFAGLSALFTAAAHFAGTPLVTLIFGDELSGYEQIFTPEIISVCVYALASFEAEIAIIKRNFRALIIGYTIGMLIGIPANYFFINFFGLSGASYGLIVASSSTVIFLKISCKLQIRRIKK